ncbi:hypothetical protein DFH09DRAFT_1291831 [Mycena vulgaris]|nr:hypothetical protein DFH09DRAFT_1291831 [Mycena vulgaris]
MDLRDRRQTASDIQSGVASHRIKGKYTPLRGMPTDIRPLGVLWQINAERKEEVQTILFLAPLQFNFLTRPISCDSAPLQHRAITGCSSQNTTQLGSDLLTVQFNLNNVNFLGSVNNSRLFFNAQLSILDATEANDQLQSAALFGALASPPPDNALDTLGSALADAQSKLAAFVVVPPVNGTPRVNGTAGKNIVLYQYKMQ